jgi:poly(hydroxyalkanoate) depolymerase family esterase
MARRIRSASWVRLFATGLTAVARSTARNGASAVSKAVKAGIDALKPPPGPGDWIPGMAIGAAGARRYRLYRPPGATPGERLPLMVMLHGCGQDAKSFATSTRMNRIAARQRFAVLYPEQDRLVNAQGCWNWFDTRSGRAQGEAALIMKAIDQVCLLYAVDRERVAVAGLSAGASMAALLATTHPERFKAVVMHSGIPPGSAHSSLSALGAMRGRRTLVPQPTEPVAKPRPSRR